MHYIINILVTQFMFFMIIYVTSLYLFVLCWNPLCDGDPPDIEQSSQTAS